MKWPWLPPSKGDIAAIIFAVLFASFAVFTLVRPPNYARIWNNGFGPEWHCTSVGRGEPVCTKRPLAASEKPAKTAP